MSVQSIYRTESFSVGDLVRGVATGQIALPDFQRDFVWEPAQVLELIDSASHGWPIGSLLALRGPQPFDVKPIAGGPAAHADRVRLYLLDGQQRLTALFHTLADVGETVYYAQPDDLDDDGEQRLRWQRRDRFAKRSDADRLFRISELADEKAFTNRISMEPESERSRLRDFRARVLGALADDEYKIPCIVMDSNIDLEALTRIFETLNRTGVKLDAFDLMVAVMRRADFILRRRWEEAIAEYSRFDVMSVDGIELLKLIALWQREDRSEMKRPPGRRVRGVRQRDVLNVPPESIINNWNRAVQAYQAALEFLDVRAGIKTSEGIPSWAMVLVVAYFIDREVDSDTIQAWYWLSVALQSYSQGANTQVLSDIDAMNSGRLPDKVTARAALELGLNDSVNRNKILKLGIRGIATLTGQRDLLDGEVLSAPMIEISIPSARDGELRAPRGDSLVDTGLTTPRVLSLARANLRKSGILSFDDKGLDSQGFLSGASARITRRDERWFLQWFEEWL